MPFHQIFASTGIMFYRTTVKGRFVVSEGSIASTSRVLCYDESESSLFPVDAIGGRRRIIH